MVPQKVDQSSFKNAALQSADSTTQSSTVLRTPNSTILSTSVTANGTSSALVARRHSTALNMVPDPGEGTSSGIRRSSCTSTEH